MGAYVCPSATAVQICDQERHFKPGTTVQALVINPSTPTIVYAGTLGDGVFKSTNAGGSWTAAIYTAAIRAAVTKQTSHAAQELRIDRLAVEIENPRNSTHLS